MNDRQNKFVALLRGVNVGGANKVAMADLRALAVGLGWGDVKTYIASGNLVAQASKVDETLGEQLRAAMVAQMGVDVPVTILTAQEILAISATCPFKDAGNRIHLFVCDSVPVLDEALKTTLIVPDETVIQDDRFVWFHAPSGVGRSKLFAKMETVLGVTSTARNLNTLQKLAEMADAR